MRHRPATESAPGSTILAGALTQPIRVLFWPFPVLFGDMVLYERGLRVCVARLLISGNIWRKQPQPPADATDLGLVELRGHSHPVRLFKLA